jgi:hypothetical protein
LELVVLVVVELVIVELAVVMVELITVELIVTLVEFVAFETTVTFVELVEFVSAVTLVELVLMTGGTVITAEPGIEIEDSLTSLQFKKSSWVKSLWYLSIRPPELL